MSLNYASEQVLAADREVMVRAGALSLIRAASRSLLDAPPGNEPSTGKICVGTQPTHAREEWGGCVEEGEEEEEEEEDEMAPITETGYELGVQPPQYAALLDVALNCALDTSEAPIVRQQALTRNPKPQTRNPKPQTPNPKPQNSNPEPQTPNPKP